MSRSLLVLVCLLLGTFPVMANDLKADMEELYRPVDAQTVQLLSFTPVRASRAKRATADLQHSSAQDGDGRCPRSINIGSVEGQSNKLGRLDTTVVISEPIVINCRR